MQQVAIRWQSLTFRRASTTIIGLLSSSPWELMSSLCRSSLWFDRLDDNIYLAYLLVCIQQTRSWLKFKEVKFFCRLKQTKERLWTAKIEMLCLKKFLFIKKWNIKICQLPDFLWREITAWRSAVFSYASCILQWIQVICT